MYDLLETVGACALIWALYAVLTNNMLMLFGAIGVFLMIEVMRKNP